MANFIMKDETLSIDASAPSRLALLVLLALFAAGLLVVMPNLHAYYFGDEHYYTDSAIWMHQSGQVLTPTYADGAPRFNKPVLSYWMILAGFRAFGVSVLSSRIASLLAGLGILLLTRLLAVRLFKSPAAGWLAMLIMASNIELMTASMRATPDIFLCLFSLLGLYGFAGLLLGEPRPADAWLGFIGAGLAIASKGMLGILLLLFILLFALIRSDRKVRLQALTRAPVMRVTLALAFLSCLALGLAWFVAVYAKFGNTALNGFLHDQVGNRVSSSTPAVLTNLFQYSLGLALPFFPWSVLLIAAFFTAKDRLARLWNEQPARFLFLLGWYALLLFVFSPANLTRTRYLLPAFPGLAIGIGGLLAAALDRPALARLLDRFLQLVLVLLPVPSAVFIVAASVFEKPRLFAAGGVLFLLALVLGLALRLPRLANRSPALLKPALLAFACFAIIWDFQFLVRPAFPSTPSYAMVHKLRKVGVNRVYFPLQTTDMSHLETSRYKEKFASQIRLISGGAIEVDRLDLDAYLAKPRRRPILCMGDDLTHFPRNRYKAVQAGRIQREGLKTADFWNVLRAPDRDAALRTLFVPCYIIFPRKIQATERTPPP